MVVGTEVGSHGGILGGQHEGGNNGGLKRQLPHGAVLGRIDIDVHLVGLGHAEVDVAVGLVPDDVLDGGVEVARDGFHLACSKVHDVGLFVVVVGDGKVAAVLADAVEGLGASGKEQFRAVGRVPHAVHIGFVGEDGINRARRQVKLAERGNIIIRMARDILVGRLQQHLFPVGRDVGHTRGLLAEGEALGGAALGIVDAGIGAVAVARDTVAGGEDMLQRAIVAVALVVLHHNHLLFVGEPLETFVRQGAEEHLLLLRERVDGDEVATHSGTTCVPELVGTRHPAQVTRDVGDVLARLHLGELDTGVATVGAIVVGIARDQILAAGRELHAGDAVVIDGIVEHETPLRAHARRKGDILELLLCLNLALDAKIALSIGRNKHLEGDGIGLLGLHAQGDGAGTLGTDAVLRLGLRGFTQALDGSIEGKRAGDFQVGLQETLGAQAGGDDVEDVLALTPRQGKHAGGVGRNDVGGESIGADDDVRLQQIRFVAVALDVCRIANERFFN